MRYLQRLRIPAILAAALISGCEKPAPSPATQATPAEPATAPVAQPVAPKIAKPENNIEYSEHRVLAEAIKKQWMNALARGNTEIEKPVLSREAYIQWKPLDCTEKLMLPAKIYSVSQFGRGKYRIDTRYAYGHFNNIYMIFQPEDTLDPVTVDNSEKSPFTLKGETYHWRSFRTKVEGISVIRKEIVIPNILPHQHEGSKSHYIWLRMDSYNAEINDILTPVVEAIIQNAAN
ncbi:hypothetical protein LCGC14_2124510 [marine sediment metagenome]|uniref:Uncharacterized protein n=1 Tax=marine sediment metagenome TaxID=412755 RepID=A0A0F9EQE5_9ZZZZ